MQFRREKAAETLLRSAQALAEHWRVVAPDVRGEVAALIREFGPKIAQSDPQNCSGDMLYVLRGLWGLRERLPAAVGAALRAGAGAGTRLPAVVTEDERDAVLAALVRVHDGRTYRHPAALARQMSELIRERDGLLTDRERNDWSGLERDYARAGDPVRYLDELPRVLPRVETLNEILSANRTWTPHRAGHLSLAGEGPGKSQATAAPALFVRTAHVHFPPSILLSQKRVPLVVYLTGRPVLAPGSESARLAVLPGEVTVVVTAEDFALAGTVGGRSVPVSPAARSIVVERDSDCEPVVFFLDPLAVGRKRIGVDVYQSGASVAALLVETRVVSAGLSRDDLATGDTAELELPATASEAATPPDLELRVMLLADGRTLSFMLHSHNGDYNFRPAGRVTLLGEPRAFLESMLGDLSQLARLAGPDRNEALTREALRRINTIGMRLYDELWPEELKREYAETIRTRYAGKTLLITSDEPWIPWEMIRPFSVQGGRVAFNDPPLCENFRLARWLAGRGAPTELRIRRGVIVAPPGNLAAVRSELDYFDELRRRKWELELRGPMTRVSEVLDEVEDGSTQLLHLSSHGNFDASDPLSSALKLADGYLRPAQLLGEAQAGISRAAPLVFLNACHAGQNGLMLTRIGGWAELFLSAGAGAFIGSLWEINDRLAAVFARAFYDGVFGCKGRPAAPVGEAFHQARQAIKALDPANPTWLAYVLYAAPNTRLKLAEAHELLS